MDSTSDTTGCLTDHRHHHATYAELTDAYWLDSPTFIDNDPSVRPHGVASVDHPDARRREEPARRLGAA
jgi:hypothetical protein